MVFESGLKSNIIILDIVLFYLSRVIGDGIIRIRICCHLLSRPYISCGSDLLRTGIICKRLFLVLISGNKRS